MRQNGDKLMTTSNNSRNRSWMLTIPAEGLPKRELKKLLGNYTYIGQLERGEKTDYLHWQLYIENEGQIRFTTLKRKFPKAHIEPRRKSKKSCYDYVTKSKTAVENSRIENGEIKVEDDKVEKLELEMGADLMKRGMRFDELMLQHPNLGRYMKYYEELQRIIDKQENSTKFRDITVQYIYGAPGTGKTKWIYDNHKFDEVYRVTNYKNPFDTYNGEDVLVFDEFASQIPFSEMLTYLDVYPLELPARYYNRWAAYTKVYIISNAPLHVQYRNVADSNLARINAFYRRIANNCEVEGSNLVRKNDWLDCQIEPMKRLNFEKSAKEIMMIDVSDFELPDEELFNIEEETL